MKLKQITLELTVTVPADTDENDVTEALNGVLDEPPCDWGDWIVGAVLITGREAMKDKQIHHIDGDPLNNDPANLRVTLKENRP